MGELRNQRAFPSPLPKNLLGQCFLNFNMLKNCPGILLNMQILIKLVWDEAWKFAFLTVSQVMLLPLVPHSWKSGLSSLRRDRVLLICILPAQWGAWFIISVQKLFFEWMDGANQSHKSMKNPAKQSLGDWWRHSVTRNFNEDSGGLSIPSTSIKELGRGSQGYGVGFSHPQPTDILSLGCNNNLKKKIHTEVSRKCKIYNLR